MGVAMRDTPLHHGRFTFAGGHAGKKHTDDGGGKTHEENREAEHEPDEQDDKGQECLTGSRRIRARLSI